MAHVCEKDHFWLYLLALGFDPNKCPEDVNVGRNMFDKPNPKAFAVVALFLFTKLDKDRAQETFRNYVLGAEANLQFRKQCCKWLGEISHPGKSRLPKITASSLLSPTGPKFVHLVYWFARYVMIEDMRKFSVGTCIPFAEAVTLRPEDKYIAKARRRVGYNKLLQILQKGDIVIQEYGKKAQVLVKEIEETESEYAVMQIQSLRMKQNDQNKSDTVERIEKVRSMWTLIMEMLTSLKKDKEVVDSILENCAHQCILDGTDVVLRVPGLLTHRIENDEGFIENVYEDGKLKFLAVIHVLNETLRMLRNEHCQSELKELHKIENMVKSCNNLLQNLNTKRPEREHQHCVSVCESISRKEEDWEMKWKTFLGHHPFNSIFKEDLEPSSTASPPQSPSLPEEDKDRDLHQYLASISGIFDSLNKERCEKDEGALETMMDKSSSPPKWISSVLLKLLEAPENRDLLIKNNLHMETCGGNKKPVPPQILKNGKEEFLISEMQENSGQDVTLLKTPVEKEDLLEKARDELAEEIAKTVMSESPDSDEEKGMSLDDLVSSLCFNPFITRREIPRTPENLYSNTSWIQETERTEAQEQDYTASVEDLK
ncbi:HAUS augmin-like complex subunit 6 isoform X1 [Manacus candei]|nr:HAUS augmin-like complex subunit 6 isoform X1 [Manacus candei]